MIYKGKNLIVYNPRVSFERQWPPYHKGNPLSALISVLRQWPPHRKGNRLSGHPATTVILQSLNPTIAEQNTEKNGLYANLLLPCEGSWGGKPVVALPCKNVRHGNQGDLPPLMDMTNLMPKARIRLSDNRFINAYQIAYNPEVMVNANKGYI